ncbi:MAG: trimethylamine methyltransferase family protein [Bacillota bacterium]|nr:trimethylamine methyltransferase family protein [Bacillota bacterium]
MFKHWKGSNLRVLSEKDITAIHEATVNLLENTGIKMHNDRARQIFSDHHAKVDHDNQIVKIPRSMLEEAIDSTPSSLVLCGREEKNDLILEGANVYLGTGGTVLNTLDLENGRKRLTEVKDVAGYAKLADALDNIAFFVINCYPSDVKTENVDINRFYHALANTSKHVMGGIYTMEGLLAVIEMAEQIAGGSEKLRQRPFVSFITLMMSPLVMEVTYTDFLIEIARRGLPVATPSEPLAGANSPVTLAGTITLNNAESLGGLVLAQLVNKGTPTIYGSTSSIMDMRTGTYMAGSIESALINAGCAQMAQYYKIPVYGTGGMSDSKVVDAQAGYESANTAMVVALSGCNYIHDAFGLLEFCTTLSYEKMVIDNDSVGMILRAVRGIKVDKETIANEVISDVGPGGHFLDHPHTVKHVREEFYFPRLSDRQQRSVWAEEGSKDTFERAREKAKEILAGQKAPGFSEDLENLLFSRNRGLKKL